MTSRERAFYKVLVLRKMPNMVFGVRLYKTDFLTTVIAEAANNVYETHLENKQRFDLHRRPHSFTAGDLVLYDWPKKGNHKLSPIFKGPFVIVRPVGAICYEIKSMTQQNKFIKVVHVHLRPYFKRNTPTIEENSTDEETERY
ncbi:uncharacterized protein NPIL_331431 [Nephila pilipes]|uniref:Uncharacterized protein n=1 Tax=Nephila pilipes TaxID=299642 RepID=A0A8X6NJN7_NEPPI|nr:uncharacterized protein NPIL_331431 [Nephila pilipes]